MNKKSRRKNPVIFLWKITLIVPYRHDFSKKFFLRVSPSELF